VLAYVPYLDDLAFAMRLAANSSLAVVETVGFPLAGWAAWFEATDLISNQSTPPIPSATRKAVERLKFYGNNAFGDPLGKKMAHSLPYELQNQGDLNHDYLLGAVLGAGVSPRGIKNLQRLIG
jgi:hypothetical protein